MSLSESSSPNGHIGTDASTTVYCHNHTEVHMSQGFQKSCVIDDDEVLDRTVISGNTAMTVHAERHSKKLIQSNSMESIEKLVI